MLEHLSCGQLACFCDLIDLVISEADDDVFWLKISVNDFAHAMHVVETDQALSGQFSNQWERHTLIIIALYNFEEIYA